MGLQFWIQSKIQKKTLYKDEHLEIQEMISFVLQVISNDKDVNFTVPSIMSCIGAGFTNNLENTK